MTESQEPKSQLEDTSQEKKDLVITPLAIHYNAEIVLDDSELRAEFDKYWEEFGEGIALEHYKGKKKKGGKLDLSKAKKVLESTLGVRKLYNPVLTKILGERVEQESDMPIMFVTDLSLLNFEKEFEDTIGIIQYYYWPNLEMDAEIDFEIKRDQVFNAESEFVTRCKVLQDQQRTYSTEETDIDPTKDQRVFVDIIVSSDGEALASLTKRSSWLDVKHISPESIKTSILEHHKGDLFELDFEHEGKECHAHVKIYDVNDIEYLDIEDEELYKKAGHASRQDFKDVFMKNFESFVDQHEKNLAYNKVITQIMFGSKYSNIPQRWIVLNRDNSVASHLAAYGNDKNKALKAIGASTEDQMRDMFAGQVYKDTVTQMVLYWYSKKFNCLADAQSVANDAWSRAIWVD